MKNKKVSTTSFPKEIFSVYFEHNRNSIKKLISSLEHVPKSNKNASAFLKPCSTYVKSAKEIFFSIFITLNPK